MIGSNQTPWAAMVTITITTFASFAIAAPTTLLATRPALQTSSSNTANSTHDPFLWPSTAPLTVESLLSHFERFDREMKTFRADFTQSLTFLETALTQHSEGTVSYLKPDRLRIEHLLPEKQTVVADGKELWIHRHSHNQVIQSKLAEWKKADPTMNSLLQLGSYGEILKNYDVRIESTAPSPTLVLRPKSGSKQDFTLRLKLAHSNLFPQATELTAASLRVDTRFSNIAFNPPLAQNYFQFQPPSGAEIFRNFKPPQLSP